MGRVYTRMSPPPVRLSRALARTTTRGLDTNPLQVARGAGNYGQKERRFSSVPVRLVIKRAAPVNASGARAAVKPMGPTRRKRGLAPVSLPSSEG